MSDFVVVIPARYQSQRLPGKPLADIHGASLIERVYGCAVKSLASRVIVATDDARIESEVKRFGGEVCMTSPEHASGTDRLEEVARKCGFQADDIIVNVQGDEPLIPAEVINQVAHNLIQSSAASAATLCEKIHASEEIFNPNVVKVVKDLNGKAMYFSRAPIPWLRDSYSLNEAPAVGVSSADTFRHIGIYAYRVKLLQEFVGWPVSYLEGLERLEQLRILENGRVIHVEEACAQVPGGVDTPEDLNKVREIIQGLAHGK